VRVSGVDVKVEFWRFRPCPFFGSNGSPHSKDLQTMVSHAHWERKLSTFSVNDLGPADRNSLSLDWGRCG
jgi:hypothetical protein